MKLMMIAALIISFGIVITVHSTEHFILNESWVVAYAVFAAPSALMMIACILSKSPNIYKTCAIINWFFIFIWVAMLRSGNIYLVLPATGMVFAIIAVLIFLPIFIKHMFHYVKKPATPNKSFKFVRSLTLTHGTPRKRGESIEPNSLDHKYSA